MARRAENPNPGIFGSGARLLVVDRSVIVASSARLSLAVLLCAVWYLVGPERAARVLEGDGLEAVESAGDVNVVRHRDGFC